MDTYKPLRQSSDAKSKLGRRANVRPSSAASPSTLPPSGLAASGLAGLLEEHYTAAEIARQLGMHPTSIRDHFRGLPGVLRVGRPGYASLRIPRSVLEAWLRQARVGEELGSNGGAAPIVSP